MSTLVLASLWIFNPSGNYEPYTIISGVVFAAVEIYRRKTRNNTLPDLPPTGIGGAGGSAKVGSGYAIGGKGGRGGVPGSGSAGAGGNAEVAGEGLALGGEGGDAGQADSGGKGGRNGFEVLGVPNYQFPDGSWLWEFGRGGDGAGPPPHGDENQPTPSGSDSGPSTR